MTPEFDEVLLTAYLDDEVTDAERARVEEQLRTSEASRNLLEELRSVRNLVTQLHSTQSPRSFQQGPWNHTTSVSHEELGKRRIGSYREGDAPAEPMPISAGASLSHKTRQIGSRWKLPFQRLASIAALIAIVVCGRILLFQPNRSPVNLSEGTSTRNVPAPAGTSSGIWADESRNLDRSDMDFALSLSQALDVARSGNAQTQPAEPIANDSFDALLSDQSQEWKKMDVQEVEKLADKSMVRKVDLGQQGDSKSSEGVEPITKLYFRYQNSERVKQVLDEPIALGKQNASAKESASVEFDTQPSEKAKKTAAPPLLLELEIPSEDWESGAKRLRQLGIAVPLELPDVEYLEFTGIPAESVRELAEKRLDRGYRVAGEQELSRWIFQPSHRLERKRASEQSLETEGKISKKELDVLERSDTIHVRVRAVSGTGKQP